MEFDEEVPDFDLPKAVHTDAARGVKSGSAFNRFETPVSDLIAAISARYPISRPDRGRAGDRGSDPRDLPRPGRAHEAMRITVKLFLSFARQAFHTTAIYRFEFWLRVVSNFVWMFSAYWLWKVLYTQKAGAFDISLEQMVTYALVSSVMAHR